jgi:hypothetical protein
MRRACLAGVVLALVVSGCRSYKATTVSGRVTLDGKPLPDATVTFVPEANAPGKDPLPSSVGTTGEDGRYSLVFDDGSKKEGAVVGKHKVIITLGVQGSPTEGTPAFHKQLPERYNRKSKLECEVPPGGRSDADFDLKSH